MSEALALVEELHGLIDRLLAVDPVALDDGEQRELLVRLQGERSRLAVAAAQVMPSWEDRRAWRKDGTLRASLALGRDTRSDQVGAGRELGRARKLAEMPTVRAAVVSGELTMDHVDLLCRYATPARWGLFQRDEELLVAQLRTLRLFDDARRLVQYWANAADDELNLPPRTQPPSELYASRSRDTGEVDLKGHLSAVDAEIVDRELSRLMREIHLEDRRNKIQRTPAQRRAAALVRMAARSVNAHGATARPLFQVVVGDDTARRLCELASGIVVAPGDLAPHVDTAVFETFLFDGPSTIVSVSKRRTFTGSLRRAIQVRDRRCQHDSGCTASVVECDVDHRRPAARGGPTSQFNGELKCWPHNRHEQLRDDPQPEPERELTVLDELRARLRWRVLHQYPEEPLSVG